MRHEGERVNGEKDIEKIFRERMKRERERRSEKESRNDGERCNRERYAVIKGSR